MRRTPVLFLNVLVIATCGLVYELLAGTLASYLLGDSVTQFSWIIGLYLSAMGLGAWLARFVEDGLARTFIEVELGVALLGGMSAPLLLIAFARVGFFQVLLYGFVLAIGTLVGLELPLLMRIVKDHFDFKELVSRVLAFDYMGALAASLLFPIFFVPRLGLVRTALVFAVLNALVALWATWLLEPLLGRRVGGLRARAALVLALLGIGLIKADALTRLGEDTVYDEEVVYTQTTPYQRIVVTRGPRGFQLFLNGRLQLSSFDEYRYHEALVHPAAALTHAPRRAVVLGGGDGLALREVLRYPTLERVTLVDIDPAMTTLWQRFAPLAELAEGSFADPRVEVVNEDAFLWVERDHEPYDLAIIDFPDPHSFSLGKLYTTRFFRLLRRRLTPQAAVAIQCTSPLAAPRAYWCVIRTLEASGFVVRPYHVAVPSFGVWGFALARGGDFEPPARVAPGLRFLTADVLPGLFVFPADMLPPADVEINRLDNQRLVRYYEAEWRRWE